jgi:hypothetical protein
MTPFNVKSFKVYPQTGFADVTICWDLGKGESEESRSYQKEDAARSFIQEMKLSYIRALFSNFVNHSRILYETGNRDFYKTEERVQSLDKCMRANVFFNSTGLSDICKYILRIEADLQRILPSPNNVSRASSEDRLLTMIVFCKKEVNHQTTLSVKSVTYA